MPLSKNFNKLIVLVAPLDWGLGHASRCIPVITTLLAFGCEVIIAAEGRQRALLESEFPNLEIIHLPGYHISYGRSAKSTTVKLLLQIPKFFRAVQRENKWLDHTIKSRQIDLVISDNRYGLHNKGVLSILITHQLLIKSGFGKWYDRLLQKLNYRQIEKFSYCWIPDYSGKDSLAGELSHPQKLPDIQLQYIGALTRFSGNHNTIKGEHMLIILSGPEPQRSLLESRLLSTLNEYEGEVVLVRGLPGTVNLPVNRNPKLHMYNHLPASLLQDYLLKANMVICRSGYSSVMDLIPLGKTCVFIPTPGQPEQEYLAAYLRSRKLCLTYAQHQFSFSKMQNDLKTFKPEPFPQPTSSHQAVIDETLVKLLDPAAIYLRKNFVG